MKNKNKNDNKDAGKNSGKSPRQLREEKTYSILEMDGVTGTEPEGFATVILYIEGDIKSARLFGLN